MEQVLVSWIGGHDIDSMLDDGAARGPIINTVTVQRFDCLELLYNYPDNRVKPYIAWLSKQLDIPVNARYAELSSPIHFGDIYKNSSAMLLDITQKSPEANLNILLSPGTPAMQAVWILLSKTQYDTRYWQSSREQGVEEIEIPFEISAEYLPTAEKVSTRTLNDLAVAQVPIDAAFDDIVTQNPLMQTLKAQATVLSDREIPVLIYGESGTGKELFSRAIHNASARKDKPFVAVNCGAFPSELVDSILFGHKKGAFTGANTDKAGVFKQADGGTLFLDEFGELEPAVQVRLLRVLQDGKYMPVGATKEESVDVRLITATNRNLMEEVSEGRFREDLFYRVAIGVLHLPPLREREGDLSLLAQTILASIGKKDVYLKQKKLSIEAKKLILRQSWRGNIRELQSSLLRAALWSQGNEINASDIEQALFKMPEKEQGLLGMDINQGLDVSGVCDTVWRHYIPRALDAAQGKKSRAAELLGLNNYQTLRNMMERLGIS